MILFFVYFRPVEIPTNKLNVYDQFDWKSGKFAPRREIIVVFNMACGYFVSATASVGRAVLAMCDIYHAALPMTLSADGRLIRVVSGTGTGNGRADSATAAAHIISTIAAN